MSEQPYDPEAHPYPTTRYHAEHGVKRVENPEEERALGLGWVDTPNIPEGFLRDCGESSESKTQRVREVGQACEAFDQRLKKRASREAVKKDTPVWLIAVGSLEEELNELAFGVIEIYLKSWEKCNQNMDSQKDKWFREGLLEYIVKDQLDKKLELLKQGYGKQLPPREKMDQRCEELDKVGMSVVDGVRQQLFPREIEIGSESSRGQQVEPQIQDGQAGTERQVKATTERKSIFPSPRGTPWEDVTIDFIEEVKIKVEARGNVDEYFYDKIGFGNNRDGKPTKLWGLFRNLAMLNGCASADDLTTEEIQRKNISKYISDLRKKLIALMGIKGDPFFDVAEASNYHTKFALTASFFKTSSPLTSDHSYEEYFNEEISLIKLKAKGNRKPTSDHQFKHPDEISS